MEYIYDLAGWVTHFTYENYEIIFYMGIFDPQNGIFQAQFLA